MQKPQLVTSGGSHQSMTLPPESLLMIFQGVDSEEIEVDGNGLRAWPCDFKLVDKLKRASATSLRPLSYRVYNRRGGSQIRRVTIFEPAK
ncbi:MAG: hypothetical protein AAB594_00910 [Patescibacteria group bacterium]